MNIFVTDSNPVKAAFDSCNSHSVKMPLEVAQMMSAAVHRYSENSFDDIYKLTHQNHPCTVWAGNSKQNFEWLYQYGIALCNTYSERYSKNHACREMIEHCYEYVELLPDGVLEPFAIAINHDAIKALNLSVVDSYRLYIAYKHLTKRKLTIKGKEQLLITWKNYFEPDWLQNNILLAESL